MNWNYHKRKSRRGRGISKRGGEMSAREMLFYAFVELVVLLYWGIFWAVITFVKIIVLLGFAIHGIIKRRNQRILP